MTVILKFTVEGGWFEYKYRLLSEFSSILIGTRRPLGGSYSLTLFSNMDAQLAILCLDLFPSPESDYKESHDGVPQASAVRRPASRLPGLWLEQGVLPFSGSTY